MASKGTSELEFASSAATLALASSCTTGNADTWIYLVIDPDSSSNREIVIVKTHTSGSTSFSDVERDYDGRQEAAGAAADTGISHGIGTTVRMAVLAEHILDQNERVATNITSLQTALDTFTDTDAPAAIQGIQDDYDALNLQGQFNTYESTTTAAVNTALASKPSLGLVIALS